MLLATKISCLVSTPWVETHHTLTFFMFQRGAKPQNFGFLFLGAVQTLTSRNSLVDEKIIDHLLWSNVMITINTCVCSMLWRFLLISLWVKKIRGGAGGIEEVSSQGLRLSFFLTITSLDTIKSFVFPHQTNIFYWQKLISIIWDFFL